MRLPAVRMYIVDDDASFGRSLKRLLNARGISADYFGSAQSFLDSVPSSQPGYAVVDVHMPECDGFELMDKMRDMRFTMRVIVITGQTRVDSRELALQKGALGFLQKPFGLGSLMELIEQDRDGSA